MDNRKYCTNCVRWYKSIEANQCEIPSCGIQFLEERDEIKKFYIATGKIDVMGIDFIQKYLEYIHFLDKIKRNEIYGRPSQLNQDNTCYFYKPYITLWQKIKNLFK
jgi:hypothetical protein